MCKYKAFCEKAFVKALCINTRAFYRTVEAFHINTRTFYIKVKAFYLNVRTSYRKLSPFCLNIKHFVWMWKHFSWIIQFIMNMSILYQCESCFRNVGELYINVTTPLLKAAPFSVHVKAFHRNFMRKFLSMREHFISMCEHDIKAIAFYNNG